MSLICRRRRPFCRKKNGFRVITFVLIEQSFCTFKSNDHWHIIKVGIEFQEATRAEMCVFSVIVHEESIAHRTVSLLRNHCRFWQKEGLQKFPSIFVLLMGHWNLLSILLPKGVLIILWWDHSVVWWRTFSYLFVVSKINSTEWVHNFNLPMIHPYFNGLLMSISRKWDILFNGKRVERGLENTLNVYFSSLFRCVFSLELIVTMAFCTIPTDFLYRLWFSS